VPDQHFVRHLGYHGSFRDITALGEVNLLHPSPDKAPRAASLFASAVPVKFKRNILHLFRNKHGDFLSRLPDLSRNDRCSLSFCTASPAKWWSKRSRKLFYLSVSSLYCNVYFCLKCK
jgi:hypothetical protein